MIDGIKNKRGADFRMSEETLEEFIVKFGGVKQEVSSFPDDLQYDSQNSKIVFIKPFDFGAKDRHIFMVNFPSGVVMLIFENPSENGKYVADFYNNSKHVSGNHNFSVRELEDALIRIEGFHFS